MLNVLLITLAHKSPIYTAFEVVAFISMTFYVFPSGKTTHLSVSTVYTCAQELIMGISTPDIYVCVFVRACVAHRGSHTAELWEVL